MGSGSQAEDDHLGIRVTEPRDGTAPVGLPRVGGLFLTGDLFAPLNEAWAVPAGDYLLFELCERREALFM